MKKQNLRILLSGFCLSSLIALVAFFFLMAEKFGSHLLWESWGHSVPFPNLYKGLLLLIGGLFVFALKKKWGSLPRTSHELMEELKEQQTVNYRHTWRSLVLALLILVLGAGVGPEAPLLGAVIAYSIWQADKLRYLEANREQLKQLSLKDRLVRFFHPSQYLLTYTASQKGTDKKRLFFIVNGLIIFVLLMRMTEQPSFITKLGDSQWQMAELVLILPLMLYGFLFGRVYHWLMKKIKGSLKQLPLPLIGKIMIGAVAIFGVAVFAPSLLFSGQHAMHSVVEMGLELPVLALLGLSLLKLIFLEICLETGWTGGDIFPITFASILQGFAFAQFLPGYDPLFVVLVVSLSLAVTLLQKEWLAGIFISLFFPIKLWPIALLLIFILRWIGTKVKVGEAHAEN
ncbi:chloride channel protein [Streptococcus ferus]|uniref:Voltage gated chloride channel n=1 Tax=Streptococcus ferus TaxID=1345 RepID=A0A2X3XZY5_9STRE|nr:chloride channel protein [Streptococcus ferus]SQF40042.1 Voltage gated chloride channel [Streptococcus ferus]